MKNNEHLCPYCGQELEQGTLHSRGGTYFLLDGKRPPFYPPGSKPNPNWIMLPPSPYSIGTPEWPEAFACRSCKKIIVSFD